MKARERARAGKSRLEDNPFYVLGLPTTATRAEIEREGTKLLGMLELGLASAATYGTPVGTVARTPDKVRQAMATLRDPDKRLAHELWAQLAADAREAAAHREASPSDAAARSEPLAHGSSGRPRRWPDALRALGFGGRR